MGVILSSYEGWGNLSGYSASSAVIMAPPISAELTAETFTPFRVSLSIQIGWPFRRPAARRGDLHLESVECSCRDRDFFRSGHLQLHHLLFCFWTSKLRKVAE